MNFDLIIFDCDGVLVDSEVISCRAHAETLTRHGYPITSEQVLERFLGRSMRQATIEVEAELGRRLSLAQIAQPVCVASSGPPEKISASLNRTGLYDRFAPHIFSAVQVRHGKPAPDLFLFAAERMQTAPENCLVIEDSVAGIAGAIAAGMPVLGFHGGSHCREGYGEKLQDAGAAMIFDDMRQLPDLIARVGRKAG